jgi:excisionase family DNA binding protein
MDELLALSRMARRLGVTQQWLRDQAKAGQVPCLRAGTRFLFNAEAVQKALAAKAASPRQGGDVDD